MSPTLETGTRSSKWLLGSAVFVGGLLILRMVFALTYSCGAMILEP